MANETIVRIAGYTLLKRGFARRLAKEGALAVVQDCGGDGLTSREVTALNTTARLPLMRLVIWAWWRLYGLHRALGLIPDAHAAENPWLP